MSRIAPSELYVTGGKLRIMNQFHAKMLSGDSRSLFLTDIYTAHQHPLESGLE